MRHAWRGGEALQPAALWAGKPSKRCRRVLTLPRQDVTDASHQLAPETYDR